MRIRTHAAAAAAAAASLLALATPVAGASTDAATPAADGPLSPQHVVLTFVPPRVGPLSVNIGPTIISGQMIDPGLHVLMPGISLPPMRLTVRYASP
jgi:hypothetical protein